jgi:hypothetical protein
MRRLVLAAGSLASLVAGAFACTDLFHSTADVLDKCQIDAAGCTLDFCAWDSGTASRNAERVCAWLGACESPLGQNAFGPCMVQALLAFDCAANPNHRVEGETRARWACLAQAETCAQVRACVLQGTDAACSNAPSIACVRAGAGTARVECGDAGAHVENCALWSQACEPGALSPACGVSQGSGLACDNVDASPSPGECDNNTETGHGAIRWCEDGGEVSIECAGNGKGRCDGFPDASAARWLACVAESDAGAAGQCSPSRAVTCSSGGVATSCPSGVMETIDCTHILRQPNACSGAGLDPPFDWTSPCTLGSPCPQDSCDGGILTGCARGAPFRVDCGKANLGQCRMVATELGNAESAACGAL